MNAFEFLKFSALGVIPQCGNTSIAINLHLYIPSRPSPGRREKNKLNFIFTPLCGASKSFIKAFKAFIKPFEAPQRSVKMKI